MQTQKMSKRILFLILSLFPLAAGIILQFIASIICLLFGLILHFMTAGSDSRPGNLNALLLSSQFNTWVMLVYALLAILLIGVWYHIVAVPKHRPRRVLGQLINLRMLAAIVLLVASLQFFCNYLVMLIALIKPSWYDSYNNLFKAAGMDHKTILLTIYTVIAAPICEELLFRGVTLHFASKALPFWGANFLQAALFGLYHMNLVQGIYAFLIGLFCGAIYHYGQSIYLSMAFHMLFNIWGASLDNFMYYGNHLLLHLLQIIIIILVAATGTYLYISGVRQKASAWEQ